MIDIVFSEDILSSPVSDGISLLYDSTNDRWYLEVEDDEGDFVVLVQNPQSVNFDIGYNMDKVFIEKSFNLIAQFLASSSTNK